MKTIRNGEAWFSSLDEALEDAGTQPGDNPLDAPSPGKLAFASLHVGAVVVVGWALLQQLMRQR